MAFESKTRLGDKVPSRRLLTTNDAIAHAQLEAEMLERAKGHVLDYWSICRDNGWKDQQKHAGEWLEDLKKLEENDG